MTAPILPATPATGTWHVQAFPAFGTHTKIANFLARAAWHFAHVPNFQLYLPLAPGVTQPSHLKIPDGFDPAVQMALNAYLPRVKFQLNQSPDACAALLSQADVVLKSVEGNVGIDRTLKAAAKFNYRVDPIKVRQEGSYFIQCAFDLHGGKQAAIQECAHKFRLLAERIGRHSRAWVLATGPSVENYAANDYSDSVVIACNSVVLNEDLMRVCKPSILVFADPIFHFGVSSYAGRFREIIEQRLRDSELSIVVPFKYYPLLVAKFPAHAHRIIGVPFEKTPHFNFDVTRDFTVRTTSNILTLLLLPLATTFAPEVHLTGCDGRPLEQDDYFWGHGASVQINDKMENIRKVHPGFFDIDYNEYYFEHCHTLDNLMRQGEDEGIRFAHHGPSYIPALRDRQVGDLALPVADARAKADAAFRGDPRACVVIEPDGVGDGGHYVRWHRNLIGALSKRFDRVDVLCNRQQDPSLYPCQARPTFTSFSWNISRNELLYRSNFAERDIFKEYVAELAEGVRSLHSPLPAELSLYVYYGSVQVLRAVELLRADLLREGCRLKAFVCLFHESVILDPDKPDPRFPVNAAGVLFHAAAQKDAFRIACVTRKLTDLVLQRFGVVTETYVNPTPDLSDDECEALLTRLVADEPATKLDGESVILFPTIPRQEKGAQLIDGFVRHLVSEGVPAGHRYLLRGQRPEDQPSIPRLEYLGNEISDEAYWDNLRRADVMVVPYKAPCFTYRTSGILVDGLISGTPTIVVAGTWLADVVDELGAGLVVEHRSPLSIASAVKVMLANRDEVRASIRTGAVRYLAENNWLAAADFAAQ